MYVHKTFSIACPLQGQKRAFFEGKTNKKGVNRKKKYCFQRHIAVG
jgi:hypothetical protein